MTPEQEKLALLEAQVAELKAKLAQAEDASPAQDRDNAGALAVSGSVAAGGDISHAIVIAGHGNTVIHADSDPAEIIVEYLRSLREECARLPLATVDTKFADPSESQVELVDVYTDLHVVSAPDGGEDGPAWGLRMARGEGERTEVIAALGGDGGRLSVLLGDPGSGKTTLVNYLSLRLADAALGGSAFQALAGLLPLRLVLRDVGAEDNGTGLVWSALRRDLERRLGGESLRGFSEVRKRLRREGLFLLDGLDEVPEARRKALLQAVAALARELEGAARVVVTARPYAYADPALRLKDFAVTALAPLNREQADNFIRHWYQAVRPLMGWDEHTAQRRADELSRELENRPDLGDLASRPLLLTLTASLHTNSAKLPEDRADLYEESVRLLLHRWQRRLDERDAQGEPLLEPAFARVLRLKDQCLRAGLEQLALHVHARQGARRAGEAGDIERGEALAVFAPLLPDDYNPALVLDFLDRRAGLLIGRGNGRFAFLHRSFQEYLAACRLGETCEDLVEALRKRLREDFTWWREVFLLAVGKARQGSASAALGLLNGVLPDDLADAPDDHERRAALAVSLGLLDLCLSPEHRAGKALRARCVKRLVEVVDSGALAVRERAETGDVLGWLGDPRPGVGLDKDGLPDIAWVAVPASEFVMGSAEGEEDAYAYEKPQHTLHLPDFQISRYPVTNAQYAVFIETGGYEDAQWWGAAGWAWRQGAEPDLSALDDEKYRKMYADWLAQRDDRSRPRFWQQRPWNGPNRPVVGVNWFEALAFCRWLGARTGLDIRLPSEAQWEKAVRGADGRRYPWGDEWQEGLANTAETKLEGACAVGLFSGGKSPCGAEDMVGNVWEWTASAWGGTNWQKSDYTYPYTADDGREGLEGNQNWRILRGASWINEAKYARCAYRHGFNPDFDDLYVGFRVVAVPGFLNSELLTPR